MSEYEVFYSWGNEVLAEIVIEKTAYSAKCKFISEVFSATSSWERLNAGFMILN